MKGQPASTFEENNITFEAFTDLLEGKIKEPSKYYRIGSKNHEVSKFLQRKASLVSAFDDKRWMMDCMRHSLPYGSVYAKKEMQNHALFVKNKRTICKIYSLKKVMFLIFTLGIEYIPKLGKYLILGKYFNIREIFQNQGNISISGKYFNIRDL